MKFFTVTITVDGQMDVVLLAKNKEDAEIKAISDLRRMGLGECIQRLSVTEGIDNG